MSNIDQVLGDSEVSREASRVAERLVKARKVSAGAYVELKIKNMKEEEDEENQT